MEFSVDFKKNTLVLTLLLLLVLETSICTCLLVSSDAYPAVIGKYGLGGALGYCVFQCIRCIYDYKTRVFVDATGFKMYRRGKHYEFKWYQIRRIEYRGVKWCRAFDVLVIHTTLQDMYVDSTFSDYRYAWKVIKHYLQENNPEAIIDNNLPD